VAGLILACAVALVASGLTLFSGFGLGTLLLPVFALFMPIELAVAATAAVHLLNNLFKVALVGRHANRHVVLRFGLPAIPAAMGGAWMLTYLAGLPDLATYHLLGRECTVGGANLVIAVLILVFAVLELTPSLSLPSLPPRALPLGGLAAGFLGGLSGHQGALRSAFLLRCGLDRDAYIGTGVVCAVIVDVARMSVYAPVVLFRAIDQGLAGYAPMVAAVTLSAFLGAWIGVRVLGKVTLAGIRRLVGILLLVLGIALGAGII